MRQQEASAGIEHQLNNYMAVSARYVHKQVDRAIEDTGFLLPDGSEGYVIANPGEGLTALAFTNPVTALPKAVRDYDSVEFAASRSGWSSNWYLNVGYTLEPAQRQLLGPDSSRTRTAAPAPTSAGCSTTRR